jgi:hypothetical protein
VTGVLSGECTPPALWIYEKTRLRLILTGLQPGDERPGEKGEFC